MNIGDLISVLRKYDPTMPVEAMLGTDFFPVVNWESDGEAVYLLLSEED